MTSSVGKKRRKPRLSEHVIKDLRSRITAGDLGVGARVPSEARLVAAYGVSRTVVREAISVLKAEGLLTSRQGAGVFVLQAETGSDATTPFAGSYDQLSDVIEVLELRAAVEIEAAGLACQRMTYADQAKIFEALQTMSEEVENGHLGARADFQFHLSIAKATSNVRYVEFLEFLGDKTIPRARIAQSDTDAKQQPRYLKKLLAEHTHIFEAISSRDAQAARAAMRSHLNQSLARYHKLFSLKSIPEIGLEANAQDS